MAFDKGNRPEGGFKKYACSAVKKIMRLTTKM